MCLGNRVTGPSADYDQDVAMALAGEMFISRSSVFEHADELSHEIKPGCLGHIGDYTTQLYIGVIVNHYKDPWWIEEAIVHPEI